MKKYVSIIVACLIVIAAAVSAFVYSLAIGADEGEYVITNENGITGVSPGGGMKFPDSEPNIAPPVTPPPAQ